MVKKHSNILIIIFAMMLFVLSKMLTGGNVQIFILIKVSEIVACGLLTWLFSNFIHRKVRNWGLRLLFMSLFGLIIFTVPTYAEIFIWCCKTSELSIITQMSIANYIFLNQTFGTHILETLFFIAFYFIIYIFGGVRNRMESKRSLQNRNTELFDIKNDENLACDSQITFVDMPHNRTEVKNDIILEDCSFEYFVDQIMSKQSQNNTKFAIRLRNGENNFHPKIFNSYSKIDIEEIKKEMNVSENSSGVFEVGKFENHKLVARLCLDMQGQPVHWEVVL